MSYDNEHPPKVLIISWSPVPTPKYQKIEGSGQRFYGLAKGLQYNGVKDITIAVGGIYPLDVNEVDGIKLFNYDFNDEFVNRLSEYDTIISNYAIHGADFISKNIPEDKQVILDAYGPAYIESLARDPEDLINTYTGNLAAVNEVFNKVLPRGDYILYANDAQEKFYTGILAALGSINQFSYKTQKLLRVPFGIDKPEKIKYDNPYKEYGINSDDFVLLWFGGLYPWFDITKVLDTVKELKDQNLKLVIVGGNNPQNQHPDFVKHYKNTVDYIHQQELDDQVILIDWVDFATRRKYYEYANAIISMNNEGKENVYSWRTRVMDYVGSTTPLITNGGDPLSDELIEIGAAFKIDDKDENSVRDTIISLVEDKEKIVKASKKLKGLQPKYYWTTVTKELSEKIKEQSKPYSDEAEFRKINKISKINIKNNSAKHRRPIKSIIFKIVQKIREKGFKSTYIIIKDKIHRRLAFEYRKRFPAKLPNKPRIVIISNQLNNTGAPFVIIDVVEQIKKQHPSLVKNIEFITFTPIESPNVDKLKKMGVNVSVYTNRELPLSFNSGDIVVFNSFAMSKTIINSALRDVNSGNIQKIFWYGHEAAPDSFVDKETQKAFYKLLEDDKAKIYAVSDNVKNEYVNFFGTSKNIELMPFRFLFSDNDFRIRNPGDFDNISFVSTGSLMDMRKGQYPILYAFLDFYHNCYIKNPDDYRNFDIKFIGAYEKFDLSKNAPYHIQNIMSQFSLSAHNLDDHIIILPSMSHDDAISEIKKSDFTICYSLHEALPIFVYEGMAAGHPIIRNDCAGKEEQLIENENGFAVYSDDFSGLVDTIEKILNKSKTSNKKLSEMSSISNKIAKKATKNTYQIIDEIAKDFKK